MVSSEPEAVFLSLRPRFASAILDGSKTAEVRRRCPRALPGALALLYAASPVREVVGTCIVADVVRGSASRLWERYGDRLALSRTEFREYLAGAADPTVLVLDHARPLLRPVPLADLRVAWAGFRPPQSYRFISRDVASQLVARGA